MVFFVGFVCVFFFFGGVVFVCFKEIIISVVLNVSIKDPIYYYVFSIFIEH